MPQQPNINIADFQQQMNSVEGGSRYKAEGVLGGGSYGVVLCGKDTLTGKQVAIKRINPDIFKDVLLARRILREIKMLGHFEHDNIIGLVDLLPPPNPDFEHIYIIMDAMETDLRQIYKSEQKLSEEHVKFFIYQILRGLDCVHKAGVIHRDLTPSNILLNTNCDLKICDFGLAKEAAERDVEQTDYVVMRWYRAPELVMEHKHYNTAVDLWACGCILGEMFHNNKPVFQGKDRINQLDVILDIIGTPSDEDVTKIGSVAAQRYLRKKPRSKGEEFKNYFHVPITKLPLCDAAVDLLRRMLTFNPEKRITVAEAINHPYLQDLHEPADIQACNPPKFEFREDGLKDLPAVRRAIHETCIAIHKRRMESIVAGTKQGEAAVQSVQSSPAGCRTAMQHNREGEDVSLGGEDGWMDEDGSGSDIDD